MTILKNLEKDESHWNRVLILCSILDKENFDIKFHLKENKNKKKHKKAEIAYKENFGL